MWAVNISEASVGEWTTFSNKSNNWSLDDLTSSKKNFFSIYQNPQSNLL